MGWRESTPSDDVEAADWIGPRLLPFRDARIGSVIPTGFDAYVRIDPHIEFVDIARRHTTTPEHCWFCLWEGYGYLHAGSIQYLFAWSDDVPPSERIPPPPPAIPKLRQSRVRLPARDYLLFTGPVEEAAGWEDGPNLWWPDDRAWCVASEIDLDYTLVGGSVALCDELAGIGAEKVSPESRN